MSKDTAPIEKPKSSQWRLSTLLVVMLGFAVLFGGIANMRGVVDMKVSFQSLAPNDDRLEAWLKESYGVSKLSIKRPDEHTVALRFSRAFYAVDIPSPPWKDLGYGPTTSFVFTQGQSAGWSIPIGLVIIALSGRISRFFDSIVSRLSRPNKMPAQSAMVADG